MRAKVSPASVVTVLSARSPRKRVNSAWAPLQIRFLAAVRGKRQRAKDASAAFWVNSIPKNNNYSLHHNNINTSVDVNPPPSSCQSQHHRSPLLASFTGVCTRHKVDQSVGISCGSNTTLESGQLQSGHQGRFQKRRDKRVKPDLTAEVCCVSVSSTTPLRFNTNREAVKQPQQKRATGYHPL